MVFVSSIVLTGGTLRNPLVKSSVALSELTVSIQKLTVKFWELTKTLSDPENLPNKFFTEVFNYCFLRRDQASGAKWRACWMPASNRVPAVPSVLIVLNRYAECIPVVLIIRENTEEKWRIPSVDNFDVLYNISGPSWDINALYRINMNALCTGSTRCADAQSAVLSDRLHAPHISLYALWWFAPARNGTHMALSENTLTKR